MRDELVVSTPSEPIDEQAGSQHIIRGDVALHRAARDRAPRNRAAHGRAVSDPVARDRAERRKLFAKNHAIQSTRVAVRTRPNCEFLMRSEYRVVSRGPSNLITTRYVAGAPRRGGLRRTHRAR